MSISEQQQPAEMGLVEHLVRDDGDRKKFLRAVGAAGAASFGAFVLAACGGSKAKGSGASTHSKPMGSTGSTASPAGGDVAIVNYALTLEHLEAQFYTEVIAAGLFHGKPGALLKEFGGEEAAHVEALTKTVGQLGGTPAAKPEGRFPIKSAGQVGALAYTLENLGASAYLGQAPRIQSREVLAAALSIHTVEARHAATLGTLVKKPVTPDGAFASPMGMASVLKAIEPYVA